MVKKIKGPEGPKKASEVDSVKKTEQVSGVSRVTNVSGVSSVSSISKNTSIDGVGPKLSRHNQEEVLKTIDSEAERMFAGKKIPRKRQKTITDALKMAVLAATLDEEEDEEDPSKE